MSIVVMKVQDVPTEFECVNHGDKLDNEHFAKHTAYFINNFKKDKPYRIIIVFYQIFITYDGQKY
ncbi:hypothetical protein [uncultured Methanobrevibacter sp.]|uniref:hypothetical protein n=1 Tax=uncultured Methanobrevibacter sp. TaxID=253161 RepID=UPI0025FB6987|nr:hypothetical protein [uncultured Methanobrevibacter sp.]